MDFKYDPESDVLAVSLKKRPFSYTQEAGDFVVHFDNHDTPVYVEILNAHAFLKNTARTLPKRILQNVASAV